MPSESLITTPEGLMERIRVGLRQIPLSDRECEKVLPNIARRQGFYLQQNGSLHYDSTAFDFNPRVQIVLDAFEASGLTKDAYTSAFVKRPDIILRPATRIIANIRGVVNEFANSGLTEPAYIAAAIEDPKLFDYRPKAIVASIRGVVEKYSGAGLTETDYIKAARRHTSLFYQSPDTICGHIELATQLYQSGRIHLNPKRYGLPSSKDDIAPLLRWFVDSHPSMLSLCNSNYVLRMAHAELMPHRYKKSNILLVPRRQIENNIAEYFRVTDLSGTVNKYGYDPNAVYDHTKPAEFPQIICRLIDLGYLKSLRFAPKP